MKLLKIILCSALKEIPKPPRLNELNTSNGIKVMYNVI